MKTSLICLFGLALLSAAGGCAMCASPFDCDYSAHGGRWQRHDMTHGRVGSVFQPAGGPVEAAPAGHAPAAEGVLTTPPLTHDQGAPPGQLAPQLQLPPIQSQPLGGPEENLPAPRQPPRAGY